MSATTWMLCSKIVLISMGAISIAVAIKLSVPSIMAFAFYDVPTIWSTLVSWLKPPYIYFIVNGIIITIVASSRFSHKVENSEYSAQTQPLISAKTIPPAHVVAATIPVQSMPEINVVETPLELAYDPEDETEANIVELKPVVVNGVIEAIENEAYDHVLEDDDDFVISKSTWSPPEADEADEGHHLVISKPVCRSSHGTISPEAQLDYLFLPVEKKPLLPSKFGQWTPIKVIPEGGRATRVTRPKKHETLESTWKMIMESRERELKKSETFENHGRHLDVNAIDEDDGGDDDDLLPQHVLKSETFRDRTNYDDIGPDDAEPGREVPALGWPSNVRKIRKELSLSQDELNRRVEAFIKKFNEDMRLQRQESIDKYMEMINRGAN